MILMSKRKPRYEVSGRELQRLQREFEQFHCINLPGFMEQALVREVQEKIRTSKFYNRLHKDIALESCMRHDIVAEYLGFMTNDLRLFRLFEKITGCPTIQCFVGRIYRLIPDGPYYDSWHGDLVEGRLLALSVNLSDPDYQGGDLQIRDKETKNMIAETRHHAPGDAILFRIAPYLRHRVAPLEGKAARTVYAGWFRSFPDFREMFSKNNERKTLWQKKIGSTPRYASNLT